MAAHAKATGGSLAAETALENAINYRHVYSGVTVPIGQLGIALRFDDIPAADFTDILTRLTSRGLVAGFGAPSSYVGGGGLCTAAQLLLMQDVGMEIMPHSVNHLTTAPTSDSDFYNEFVPSFTALTALGLRCQTWVQPGSWLPTTSPYYFDLASEIDGTYAGWLARSYAAGLQAYVKDSGDGRNPIPQPRLFGSSVITPSSLAVAQASLYNASQAVTFLFHTALLGTAGNLTSAELNTFLDNIVTLINAGQAKNLTPTGLMYAQYGADVNLLRDPGFEASATGALRGWQAFGAPTIVASGRSGVNAASVNSGNSLAQDISNSSVRTMYVEGYAKRVAPGAQNARLLITQTDSFDGLSKRTLDQTFAITDVGWTKIAFTVGSGGLPTNTGEGMVTRFRPMGSIASPDNVLWDDFKVIKL